MVKNHGSGSSWVTGVIAQQIGPVTYLVDMSGNRLWKRHVDHLKEIGTPHLSVTTEPEVEVDCDVSSSFTSSTADVVGDDVVSPQPSPEQNATDPTAVITQTDPLPPPETNPPSQVTLPVQETNPTPPHRYPSCSR